MILYALSCDHDHPFESWFPSSDAYEAQRRQGLVTCPVCDSAQVEKQIMAPAVNRSDRAQPQPTPTVPPSAPALPSPLPAAPPPAVALLGEREQAMRAMLKAMREHVLQNAEDVGRGFVEEARRMHMGETEERSIFGEADAEEAQALRDEGIEVQRLPFFPDDRH